jgi:hypothetical protein
MDGDAAEGGARPAALPPTNDLLLRIGVLCVKRSASLWSIDLKPHDRPAHPADP